MLQRRGFTACEIDFEGGFWMDYDWATEFGKQAREAKIALSVHAPIAGFMGHVERDKKQRMAVGMLDHSAGIAKAAGAEPVVFHPGFLLGRTRAAAIKSIDGAARRAARAARGQGPRGALRGRGDGQGAQIGSLDDVLEISRRLGWVCPVLDFAHMHATSDGAFTDVEPFAAALEGADQVLEPGAPFHIHFSDIAYANRNETKHLPYGDGTFRAEPLKQALRKFRRTANVISESPDLESSLAIQAVLASAKTPSRRASSSAASSSRPPSRKN